MNQGLSCLLFGVLLSPASDLLGKSSSQNPPGNQLEPQLYKTKRPIACLSLSEDGTLLVASNYNYSVTYFEVGKNSLRKILNRKASTISRELAVHPKNSIVAMHDANFGGNAPKSVVFVAICPVRKSSRVLDFRLDHERHLKCLAAGTFAFGPNGKTFAYGSVRAGHLEVWPYPPHKGSKPLRLDGHRASGIHSVCFSKHNARLLATSGEKCIRLWDLTSRKKSAEIPTPKGVGPTFDLSFSKDEKLVGIVYRRTTWEAPRRVYSLIYDRAKRRKTTSHIPEREGNDVTAARFLNQLDRVLVGDNNGECYFWDVSNRKKLQSCQLGSPISSITKTSDDRLFAVGCENGTIALISPPDSR